MYLCKNLNHIIKIVDEHLGCSGITIRVYLFPITHTYIYMYVSNWALHVRVRYAYTRCLGALFHHITWMIWNTGPNSRH